MSDKKPVQAMWDTPVPIEYVKGVAKAFNEIKDTIQLPKMEMWQKNQDVTFYHGMLSGIQNALNGLQMMGKSYEITPEALYSELSIMLGQVANIIIEKAPKIQVIDK